MSIVNKIKIILIFGTLVGVAFGFVIGGLYASERCALKCAKECPELCDIKVKQSQSDGIKRCGDLILKACGCEGLEKALEELEKSESVIPPESNLPGMSL